MDTIIQHTDTFLRSIFEKISTEITDIDHLSSDILEECKEFSRKIVVEAVEQMNQRFREDKQERSELGLVLKEKNRPRELYTELGTIRYNRDYYFNRKDQKYENPIDEMIGVRKYERVGDSVKAKLVTLATDVSYARSSELVTDGRLSRQTVRNSILSAPILEKEPSDKRKLGIIDIYADEDHAHMQKPGKEKGKRCMMVPLVTVTEGKRQICKGRNATIRPVHFVDEKMNAKSLWESVEGYIADTYDLDSIEKIRIHADGGRWIKNGLENFSNVEHVMDGYHLKKRLRDINRRFPKYHIGSSLEIAIKKRDEELAEAILHNAVKWCDSSKDYENIKDMLTYLKSNWEAVCNRYDEGVSGSCTEGQVSHVLSERFSRNPMGWSEEGLGRLSKLRVYRKNGGKINAGHFKDGYEQKESYKEIARDYLKKPDKAYDLDWLYDMRGRYIFDTSSGTQHAIRNLGRMRDKFTC